MFTDQHVEDAALIRLAIEFVKRPEAAPLTIRIGSKGFVGIRTGKTVNKRLEFSRARIHEQSAHWHAAEAPSLQSGDSIASRIAADDIAAKKEMPVHLGEIS